MESLFLVIKMCKYRFWSKSIDWETLTTESFKIFKIFPCEAPLVTNLVLHHWSQFPINPNSKRKKIQN